MPSRSKPLRIALALGLFLVASLAVAGPLYWYFGRAFSGPRSTQEAPSPDEAACDQGRAEACQRLAEAARQAAREARLNASQSSDPKIARDWNRLAEGYERDAETLSKPR